MTLDCNMVLYLLEYICDRQLLKLILHPTQQRVYHCSFPQNNEENRIKISFIPYSCILFSLSNVLRMTYVAVMTRISHGTMGCN